VELDVSRDGRRWLAAAFVLFVLITVVRWSVPAVDNDSIHLLWTVPMSVLAVRFGLRGAVVGVVVTATLFAAWVLAHDVAIGPTGLLIRAVATCSFGLFIGHLASKRRLADLASQRWFEMSNDLLVEADLRGYFTRVNHRWELLLGWTPAELTSRPMLDFVHPDDRDLTLQAGGGLDAAPGELVNFENRYRCKDGSYRWLLWNARSDEHRKYAVARDITERKVVEARLAVEASTDPLTGLPNRRAWDAALDAGIERARVTGEPLVLALLDLDHFKRFNDERGHLAGDALLQALATLWPTVLRSSDVLARYGGEEFVVLLPACGPAEAQRTLDRLRMVTPEAQTCSIGFALWDGSEPARSLMARADAALYAAKAAGRDCVVTAPG
jgi:diguanylate cyclase (GGDEF)-like protein/PAS domain S-box-containing protein